jgi:hypothetical protein
MSSSRMKRKANRGERMDRTLSLVLAVLAVVSVVFLAAISLTVYMGMTYRATLSSTYEYRVSITSEAALGNVTLYLPIPARGPENSAILQEIGAGHLQGLPRGWNTSLIGTEKFTMLEVTAREIPPNPVGKPYLLWVNATVMGPIMTRNAGSGNLVLVPAAERRPITCGEPLSQVSPEMQCELYEGPVYADFTALVNAHLRIYLFLDGRNSRDVFGASSNEYQDGLQVSYQNGARGWHTGNGILVTGIGDYGIDFWVQEQGTPVTRPGESRLPAGWPLGIAEGTA